jgi:ATP-dependent DNA ligase
MLAKPTKAITEVLDRFEGKRFTCEYKYDGERAQVSDCNIPQLKFMLTSKFQVHKSENGKLAVFSRNSEDMSAKYPDLFEQLPKAIKEGTNTFVLDTEAVAFDRESMKLLPFQELSRRKRKDVKAEDVKVHVCLFAFDLLYLNGEVCGISLASRLEVALFRIGVDRAKSTKLCWIAESSFGNISMKFRASSRSPSHRMERALRRFRSSWMRALGMDAKG